MNFLRNKVVVITGASAGIGRALAHEFALKGANIGLIARGEKKLLSTQTEIQELGVRAYVCQLDVSNEYAMERAATEIEDELGEIDIWINNAMVSTIGEAQDISAGDVRRVMDVNFLGSVNGIMVALKRFRKRGRGHIIQIGSALGYMSIPLQSAYCASKHAIHGYIQSLRIELKAQRSPIELSEAMLPAVNTPQFEWMKNHLDKHPSPVPPIFEPELIARSIVSLAEYPQREMWIGEPSVKAILGEKIATRIAEWRLSKIGYKSQHTDLAPPTGLSNLWAPVEVDMGARGIFSSQSRKKSFFIWAEQHKKSLFFISSLIFLGSSIKKSRV